MAENKVYIFEMVGHYHRGIVAVSEEEARQIAEAKRHEVKQLVRVEKLIEGEK